MMRAISRHIPDRFPSMPAPPPRGTDVLAGKAARYDFSNASPWCSIKGLYVIPNRESREKSVILPGAQYACWVGFPFNGANCSPSKELTPKYSSTSACEKSQLIQLLPRNASNLAFISAGIGTALARSWAIFSRICVVFLTSGISAPSHRRWLR